MTEIIDVGEDIKRRKGGGKMAKLAENVQGMMGQWTEDSFPMFEETMELIRKNAPVHWAKLYLEAVKMGITKEQNINININRQRDRDDLQALVRTRVPQQIPAYTPFVEVESKEPEKIPISSSDSVSPE